MYSFLYGLKIALCMTSLVTFILQAYSKKYNKATCLLGITFCILLVNSLNLVSYILLCAFSKAIILNSAKKRHKIRKIKEVKTNTITYGKFDFLNNSGLLKTCDGK